MIPEKPKEMRHTAKCIDGTQVGLGNAALTDWYRARLQEAMGWLNHPDKCETWVYDEMMNGYINAYECTCGLDAWLREMEVAEK